MKKGEPYHQQTGDSENSTEVGHVQNKEGDGKSKKEHKNEKMKTYQQTTEEGELDKSAKKTR